MCPIAGTAHAALRLLGEIRRDLADALDAVVCLLAAKYLLEGRAVGPADQALAEGEGWIWAPSLLK